MHGRLLHVLRALGHSDCENVALAPSSITSLIYSRFFILVAEQYGETPAAELHVSLRLLAARPALQAGEGSATGRVVGPTKTKSGSQTDPGDYRP